MNEIAGPPWKTAFERTTRGMNDNFGREAEIAFVKVLVIGGFAGAAGLGNVIDKKFLDGRLGFKKKDSTASAFLRGSLVSLVMIGPFLLYSINQLPGVNR